jgi:hypothetical protein
VDVVSEGLREAILLESEIDPAGVLDTTAGKALACSILIPVLAWALGGVALKPRSAKLMVFDIREIFGAGVFFSAGFLGDKLLIEPGPLDVIANMESILRGPGSEDSSSSTGFVS